MKILVVGSGGREHALTWKIAQSPLVKKIFVAPGNGGTLSVPKTENVNIKSSDIDALLDFCKTGKVDLTVVGPEDPLRLGIVDIFSNKGLKIFGPSKAGARLESSKAYAKEFMKKHSIPTPSFKISSDYDECVREIEKTDPPIVLKADGLALGKGVKICTTQEQAKNELKSIMLEKSLGSAGNKIVIDEFIDGFELSYIAISDGKNIVPMATSQDNKRLSDNDEGPNTGGMGAYSPIRRIDTEAEAKIIKDIMEKTISGMEAEGSFFKGTLYAGLIYKNGNPLVLEYNVRFGDPETQPLLFRMKSDIVPVLLASAEGNLKGHTIEWDDRFSLCLVMASGGYPGPYEKGLLIDGPLDINEKEEDAIVFHAGTKAEGGKIYTNGGRVLGVCVKNSDPKRAKEKAIEIAERIKFKNAHFRRDIGNKIL